MSMSRNAFPFLPFAGNIEITEGELLLHNFLSIHKKLVPRGFVISCQLRSLHLNDFVTVQLIWEK